MRLREKTVQRQVSTVKIVRVDLEVSKTSRVEVRRPVLREIEQEKRVTLAEMQ